MFTPLHLSPHFWRRARAILLAILVGAHITPAHANLPEIETHLGRVERIGEAPFRVLSITIFDATLWSPSGAFAWDNAFALSLTYRREIAARALLERTIVEMGRRGASTARLEQTLRPCFANVAPGDRITGVSTGRDSAVFYHNGRQLCDIRHPNFRRNFFGIWLDATDGRRAFSERLRGAS